MNCKKQCERRKLLSRGLKKWMELWQHLKEVVNSSHSSVFAVVPKVERASEDAVEAVDMVVAVGQTKLSVTTVTELDTMPVIVLALPKDN